MKSLALPLVILSLLMGCSDGNSKKKAEQPPVPITAAKAVAHDMPVTLQFVGRAEAFESVSIKSRVDGQVASVSFTEGQHVNQGDTLIRLDPTDFSARLRQAEATTARDAALIAKMRADTARYTTLKERNFVSEEKVNDIRTNEAAADANLKASKAAEEVARLQLSYATIRSPITGIVGARLVFPGSAVKANDVVVAVVNRIHPLLVSFAVPEKYLPQLRAAKQADRLKVDVTQPGDTSQHFEGDVRFIDNAVDTTTGTIQLKAELPNQKEILTSGQYLNISLVLDTLKQAVTVPTNALQQGADGNYLYVVKDDQGIELRRVEPLAAEGSITAIRGNIQPGETVVTDGHLRLTPGSKVRINDGAEGKSAARKADNPDSANTANNASTKTPAK